LISSVATKVAKVKKSPKTTKPSTPTLSEKAVKKGGGYKGGYKGGHKKKHGGGSYQKRGNDSGGDGKWNEGSKHKRPFKTKSKIAGAKFKKSPGAERSSSGDKKPARRFKRPD
jgi:hypothetical protein